MGNGQQAIRKADLETQNKVHNQIKAGIKNMATTQMRWQPCRNNYI